MNKIFAIIAALAIVCGSVAGAVPLANGIDYRTENLQGRAGAVKTYVIDIAPESGYTVKPVLAKVNSLGLASVSNTATAVDALAAVNASYFVMGDYAAGEIIGLLKIDGKYASGLELQGQKRGALAVNAPGKADIELAKYYGRVQLPGGKDVKITNLNYIYVSTDADGVYSTKDGVVLFNSLYGAMTPSSKWWMDYTIRGGRVIAINPGPSKLQFDSNVLSVHGAAQAAFAGLKVGDEVVIHQDSESPLEEYDNIIGAGPILVRNGVPVSTIFKTIERFPADIADSCAPRTAVGLTKDGHVLLVVVDGRQKGFSSGFYIDELADYMARLGCNQALNLDGGGSSTMVVKDKVVNSPSDGAKKPFGGKERQVGNILAVMPVEMSGGK